MAVQRIAKQFNRGARAVLVVSNNAGTVFHLMTERGCKQAYLYRDLEQSDGAVEKWLAEGIAENPAEVMPYYG